MVCFTRVWAQHKTITIDTINMRGYIFDTDGNHLNYMHIQSANPDPAHPGKKLATNTNERGFFELKGAAFNDTLVVGPDIRYENTPVYNAGSRFVTITLKPVVADVNQSLPVVVAQMRKYPKKPNAVTVTVTSGKESVAENMPAKYPGGSAALAAFIAQNLKYPQSALKANLEGTVKVGFTITKEGYARNFKIINGLSDDCDDEAMRVIKKISEWEPALADGQPVTMQHTLSIQFKLTDK